MTNKELTDIWNQCQQGVCPEGWGCNETKSQQTLTDREKNETWYRDPPETVWKLMERPGRAG